jgi:hypothetical protein
MTINNLLEGNPMEDDLRTPDEMWRGLQLINEDLRNTKQQQVRIAKAAELLGHAVKRLAKAEAARFGAAIGGDDGDAT